MRIIEEKPEIWPFILLSLVIHAMFVILAPMVHLPDPFAGKGEKVIPVEFVTEQNGKLRIADIEKPAVEQKPEKTRFLGMYDSAVPEEQVGVTRRPGSMGKKGGAATSKQRPAEARQKARAGDRLLAFDERIFDSKGRSSRNDAPSGDGGAMDDFYPDFRRGAHTYLNVLRYPDVEYFVRLKRAFKIAFNPEPPLRDHFSMNAVTRGSIDVVLGVSVDTSGSLAELFIMRSSGINGYDQEAMRTVRASSPFSSPPQKFLEDDGLLRMSWTFSVYL